MKNYILLLSLAFLCSFSFEILHAQTPITNANFHQAVFTCLSTNPVDGMCTSSQYGAMPDWDVSNVTEMNAAFFEAFSFDGDLTNWDVSSVTDMSFMFWKADAFNQDIGNWDVSNVTDMHRMFGAAFEFNQDVGNWVVSNVTNIEGMFGAAYEFNQDIGNWDVSNVTNMSAMFSSAFAFNQDIANWDVSDVTNMLGLFRRATWFNQDLSSWDVSNVTNMQAMFEGAETFNHDIGSWDVGSVSDMKWMFLDASSFDQDIGSWDVSNVLNMSQIFNNSNLSTENYDAILNGWSALNLQPSVELGAVGINYCDGAQARQMIIDNFGWTIDDAGLATGCALGIDDINLSSVFVYPNPAKSILYIEGNQNSVNSSIYNLLGKEVISSNSTNRIDVSSLPKGVYFITIIDANNSATKKFIKM
jgi:surface protein